jgi:hypothetical protein
MSPIEVELPDRFEQIIAASGCSSRLGDRSDLRRKAVGLCLAAPFRDCLGEGGEQHGEPEPGRNLAGKGRLSRCRSGDRAGKAA